jgi:hypothetical protein
MQYAETLQAVLERRLIKQLLFAVAQAEDDERRNRHLEVLTDLVLHSDVALDPSRLDAWAKAYLVRLNLWIWPRTYSSLRYTSRELPAIPQPQRTDCLER